MFHNAREFLLFRVDLSQRAGTIGLLKAGGLHVRWRRLHRSSLR